MRFFFLEISFTLPPPSPGVLLFILITRKTCNSFGAPRPLQRTRSCSFVCRLPLCSSHSTFVFMFAYFAFPLFLFRRAQGNKGGCCTGSQNAQSSKTLPAATKYFLDYLSDSSTDEIKYLGTTNILFVLFSFFLMQDAFQRNLTREIFRGNVSTDVRVVVRGGTAIYENSTPRDPDP